MQSKNKKHILFSILLLFLIGVFILSFLFFERDFRFGGKDKIEKESLNYVNNQILPDIDNVSGEAEVLEVRRVLFGEYTHEILIYHQNGDIEGKRKKDGSYEFSVKFNKNNY